jgi:hypothetical protein
MATPVPGLDRLFPSPEVLARAGGDALGQLGIVRQRQAAIQALARNPIVLAGGAVLVGVVLSRFLATPSAKKLARELAAEALKQLKPAAAGAAGMAGTAAVGSLLEMGVEKYGPQISDFAKKMLAEMLRKKE